MGQTPLPFVIDDGRTYDTTGSKEVWSASAVSGLNKHQCTVQLTVFTDSKPRVIDQLLFFEGKAKEMLRLKKMVVTQESVIFK